MRYAVTALLVSAFSPLQATAAEVSLQTLLESASASSYRLTLKATEMSIEEANLWTLYSGYYPQLSLHYNNEFSRDLNGLGSGVESVGDAVLTSGTRYQSSLYLALNYELYSFGALQQQIGIAKEEVRLRDAAWCEEEKRLHDEILQSYAQTRKAAAEMRVRNAQHELSKERYGYQQRLFEAGKLSKLVLGTGAIETVEVNRRFEGARIRFEQGMQRLSALSHASLDPQKDRLLPIALVETGEEATFAQTVEAQILSMRIRQKTDEMSVYLRRQLPTLSLYSNYYLYGSDPGSAAVAVGELHPNSWKAGIGLRWNLFEGFKSGSELERLELEKRRLEEEYAMREHDFDADLAERRLQRAYLQAAQRLSADALAHSETQREMAQRLRREEQLDRIALIDTKIEHLEQRLQQEHEKIDFAFETARLEIMQRGEATCTPH